MQLNQEVIVVFIIAVSLAMAGIFILSMYFQAFMKNKNSKEFKIKVVLNPKPLVVENGIQRPPIVAITPSGEPMDPFTEQAQSDNYNNSPAIDMTRGGVFENGQEGIIAIDIQDGYDKFNDNVKNTFDSSQDLNITINEDVFTSNNESQAQAEGNGLFEKDFVAQPDLTEIGKNWEQFDVIDRLGAFEMYSPTADIFKWRLDEKSGLILKSNANYLSELTCRNGILSALSRLSNKKSKNDPLVISFTQDFGYRMLLKAVNGKHLAYGEYFDNEESVKEAIVKAVIILKDNQLLLKK